MDIFEDKNETFLKEVYHLLVWCLHISGKRSLEALLRNHAGNEGVIIEQKGLWPMRRKATKLLFYSERIFDWQKSLTIFGSVLPGLTHMDKQSVILLLDKLTFLRHFWAHLLSTFTTNSFYFDFIFQISTPVSWLYLKHFHFSPHISTSFYRFQHSFPLSNNG